MEILIAHLVAIIIFTQANYTFGPSIRVNDDPAGIHFHTTTQRSIACRGDTVYLVWRDDRYEIGLDWNSHIFLSKSTDAGNTWNVNLLIDQNLDTLACFKPHMALDDQGGVYVAYCSKSDNNNNRDIYYTQSSDGGISFAPPVMVNDSAIVQWQTFCACAVDSSGQNVYIVWEDSRNNHDEDIYLAHSTNGGLTFLPSVRVNTVDSMDEWFPVVACNNSGQSVYVAWSDQRDTMDILNGWDVYFTQSTDYGQTFGIDFPVNDTSATGNTAQNDPSIYYKHGLIYLVWKDLRSGNSGAYFDKSVDGGNSFGSDVLIVEPPNVGGAYPSITVNDSGKIFVAWDDSRDYSNYGSEIYFAFSSDSGITFSPNIRVNDHLGNVTAWDMDPAIAVNNSGRVFVTWNSDRNDPSHSNFDIYTATGHYVSILENYAVMPPLLVRCIPNPFSHIIKFIFQNTDYIQENISLRIYDAAGRLIKKHDQLTCEPFLSICWDGEDMHGQVVPSGIYFAEVKSTARRCTKKIIKIGGGR